MSYFGRYLLSDSILLYSVCDCYNEVGIGGGRGVFSFEFFLALVRSATLRYFGSAFFRVLFYTEFENCFFR